MPGTTTTDHAGVPPAAEPATTEPTPARGRRRVGNKSTSDSGSERLSVNVSPVTAAALREVSASKHSTVTETVRRAAAVLKMLEDEQREGFELQLVNRKTGETRLVRLV
ncbi:MAG TPA: hypothetical protein VGP02_14845 [Mycobacteriales bacterium]|jgi:hypothetical protein|nr:hypothetical protein [Mycobacteriales bacterium]